MDKASVPAAAAQGSPRTADLPPLRAAVVEHTPSGSVIAILDLQTHLSQQIVSRPQPPDSLDWCAAQPFLLYSMGPRLFMHKDHEEEILHDLDQESADLFACSPDGSVLAATRSGALLLAPVAQLPSVTGAHMIPMAASCRVLSLLWSPDSRFLYLLYYPAPGTESAQLLRIEAATGHSLTLAAHGAIRLLGWRGTPERLLVARRHSIAEEAGTLDAGDGFHPFHLRIKSAFVGPYLKATDQLVAQEPADDPGDPSRLRLETADEASSMRWLAAFDIIRDMSVSQNGRWVMFVDQTRFPEDSGGDIYLVEAGKQEAVLIIRATPGQVSYSLPVSWP